MDLKISSTSSIHSSYAASRINSASRRQNGIRALCYQPKLQYNFLDASLVADAEDVENSLGVDMADSLQMKNMIFAIYVEERAT